MKKTLQIPAQLYRGGKAAFDKDTGMVRLSFSSDTPYLRYDYRTQKEYYETLDHSEKGMNKERLNAGTSLLFNHERGILLGRNAFLGVENGKGYVDSKVSKADDVKSYATKIEEGILCDASVGYSVDDEGEEIGERNGIPEYRFKWTPFEVSLVTVPADISVGVGRQRASENKEAPLIEISVRTKETVDTPQKSNTPTPTPMADPIAPIIEQKPPVDIAAVQKAAREDFKGRCKKIDDFTNAQKNPEWKKAVAIVANKHKELEADFESFRTEALDAISALATKADVEDDSTRSQIEVIGERGNRLERAISIGRQYVSQKGFTALSGGQVKEFRHAFKRGYLEDRMQSRAGFTSADLANVNVTIGQMPVLLGVQRLTIMDLIASGTMDTSGFIYPVEVASDLDVAREVAERELKPEWEPEFSTDRADAKVIAVMATVPKQFLADFSAFASYLDNKGPYIVERRTEKQVLYGDGLGENLKGILNREGIQPRPLGTVASETTADALLRMQTDVEYASEFEADGYAMHPYDFEQVKMLKDENDQYIAGGPFYGPYGNGMLMKFRTIWGLPVVVSKSVTQGKPVCGAWKMAAQLFLREGMQIETSASHKDYFQRNLLAVLFEHRVALAVYYPNAFVEASLFPGRA